MRFIVAILFTILGLVIARSTKLPEPDQEELERYRQECLAESGLRALPKGIVGDASEVDDLLLCIIRKAGLIDEHGNPVRSTLTWKLAHVLNDKEKAADAVEKCVRIKDTPEATLVDNYQCFQGKTGIDLLEEY